MLFIKYNMETEIMNILEIHDKLDYHDNCQSTLNSLLKLELRKPGQMEEKKVYIQSKSFGIAQNKSCCSSCNSYGTELHVRLDEQYPFFIYDDDIYSDKRCFVNRQGKGYPLVVEFGYILLGNKSYHINLNGKKIEGVLNSEQDITNLDNELSLILQSLTRRRRVDIEMIYDHWINDSKWAIISGEHYDNAYYTVCNIYQKMTRIDNFTLRIAYYLIRTSIEQ